MFLNGKKAKIINAVDVLKDQEVLYFQTECSHAHNVQFEAKKVP